MFTAKKSELFSSKPKTTSVVSNKFVKAGLKQSAQTLSENGALKYSSTGNDFVDQFGKLSEYKTPRDFKEVSRDASILASINLILSVKFILFLRTITRVVTMFTGERTNTPQRGAGLRHEAIFRMIWLHTYHAAIFWKNIHLFISVGSWKDIITMLSYDLQYNGWKDRKLDWESMGSLILAGLENPTHSNLLKKYLPQIKANSRCTTIESQADNIIAKWIASLVFGEKNDGSTYKKYRKLKTSGTAHEWQQLISQGKHNLVDFNTVHGRALSQMVSGKYIENHGLQEKYTEWILSKPVAKYTGYPHELLAKPIKHMYQEHTVNKQFMGLVETAKKDANEKSGLIVVRDTSGSMSSNATGTTQSCFDIAKALALYFSYFLKGNFENTWIEFHSHAKLHEWQGETPTQKWANDNSSYYGSTNFQSVIDLICFLRGKYTEQELGENEFPSGILCISDMEFNPAGLNTTNVELMQQKLANAGFSQEYIQNFKVVLWNLQNSYYSNRPVTKFETHGKVSNVFYFSGYEPSTIAFLTGRKSKPMADPKNAEELFMEAMDQEILNQIEV